MKIDIYTLLGMIKDGKAPKKIKYQDEEYILNKICLEDNKTHIDYYLEGRELLLFEDIINIVLNFNDEVEILDNEEKKIPEKLDVCAYVEGEISYSWSKSEALLKTKINEIIDVLEILNDKIK